MNKILTTIVCLCFAASTLFAQSGTCGDNLTWTLSGSENDRTLTISGTGAMGNYHAYSDYAPWYDYRSQITNVTIENGVTSIGEFAFWGCSSLTDSLIIPNSVISIGEYAFSGCSSLTGSLIIPNSVTSIGYGAFSGCHGLTGSLTIPNSVTSIEDYVFASCWGLTSVTIGNSVTSIGNDAFGDCGLTSLTIGDSVTSIGGGAFAGCSGLTSLTIPNSVISIGRAAFQSCSRLTSVTIGNSVTSIGDEAFYRCSSLEKFYNRTATPQTITPYCFYGINNAHCILYVPVGSYTAYRNNSVWKYFSYIIEEIEGETTEITENSAVISWAPVANAVSYNLVLFDKNFTVRNKYVITANNFKKHSPLRSIASDETMNYEVNGLSPGSLYYYTITAIDANDESIAEYEGEFITQIASGINEISANAVSIYPNPAKDIITIDGIQSNEIIEIYDISGHNVISTYSNPIDISGLASGVYFVKTGVKTAKFIKK